MIEALYPFVEAAISLLLLGGGAFGIIGSYGLLKLRQPMQRLHAPTKASTIGVGAALVASAFGVLFAGQGISWHEVLVAAFILLTAPISALFMAKVHLYLTIEPASLPPTGVSHNWATLERDAEAVTKDGA
jgi:multicomponent K+:H+ antiporter subunit G